MPDAAPPPTAATAAALPYRPAPLQPGPSVREATVLLTDTHGPKGPNHQPPAPPPPPPPPVPNRLPLLPSGRESTLATTALHGPKAANHIPPSALPVSETILPVVDRPTYYPEGPPSQPGSLLSPEAVLDGIKDSVAAVVGRRESQAAAVPSPVPIAEALITRDANGRLPSVRESTIIMTEQLRQQSGHAVAPQAVRGAVVAAGPVVAAPHPTEVVSGRQAAAAVGAMPPVGLKKPLSQWETTDVSEAVHQVAENPIIMGAIAIGAAALTIFSVYKGVEWFNRYRLSRCIAEVERERPSVIHLYIHRRSPLSPSVSIPCTRVETFLRLAKLPYEAHVISDASVSPNGELPFAVFKGLRVAGAQNIIDSIGRELGVSLDGDLSRDEVATGVALVSAVQYSLTRGYLRSVHVEHPAVMRPYYAEMDQKPEWITRIVLHRMRRRLSDVDKASGYSQLSPEQYVNELLKDIHAVEALLHHHHYLFSSDSPSSYDCSLYAWLLPIVAMEDAAEVNNAFAYVVESEILTNFVRRMTELAFPDLDELVIGEWEEEAEEDSTDKRQVSQAPSLSPSQPSENCSDISASLNAGADLEPSASSVRPSQVELRIPGEVW